MHAQWKGPPVQHPSGREETPRRMMQTMNLRCRWSRLWTGGRLGCSPATLARGHLYYVIPGSWGVDVIEAPSLGNSALLRPDHSFYQKHILFTNSPVPKRGRCDGGVQLGAPPSASLATELVCDGFPFSHLRSRRSGSGARSTHFWRCSAAILTLKRDPSSSNPQVGLMVGLTKLQ